MRKLLQDSNYETQKTLHLSPFSNHLICSVIGIKTTTRVNLSVVESLLNSSDAVVIASVRSLGFFVFVFVLLWCFMTYIVNAA